MQNLRCGSSLWFPMESRLKGNREIPTLITLLEHTRLQLIGPTAKLNIPCSVEKQDVKQDFAHYLS